MLKKWLLLFVVVTGFAILLTAQNNNVFVTRVELHDGQKWLVITGYTGNKKTVTIPASIDGVPVRKIGDMAFRLKGLTELMLPQGLEVIGEQAFFGNQLSVVVIPASVRIIADSAFDSNMLKKVTNAGLTENTENYKTPTKSKIYYVAADKQHLNVELSGKVSKMRENFYDPLTGYDGVFNPLSGSKITHTAPKAAQYTYPVQKNTTLLENNYTPVNEARTANDEMSSVKREVGIEKAAYMNKGLNRVVIPEGTTFIGESAFASNNLSSVVIPNSVRIIGNQAFIGNDIVYITIGENVKVQRDSFRYQFSDYYHMNNYKAGTYVLKAGHWNLSGNEPPSKRIR